MSAPAAGVDALGVGCPMWGNRAWVGTHLPADTPPGSELAAYARVCNAVEGNTTFYALPAAATVRRWHEATPPGFRFLLKLPRTITHQRRLRDADADVATFVERFEPLADRLGPCSVQLPASFGPADVDVLLAFLDRLPSALTWAVEVRHPSFHAGGDHERILNDELHRRGVDRVILDSRAFFAGPIETAEERDAHANKPRLPVRAVATAGQPVVRFIGQTVAAHNPPFWAPWIGTVVRWLADGRRPLVFLHTPDNDAAPMMARDFHAAVVSAGGQVAPLADPPAAAVDVALFDSAGSGDGTLRP